MKRSWHSAAAMIIAQGFTVITAALAVRSLGKANYGIILAIAAYFGWFGLLAGFSVHAYLPRFLADRDMPRRDKNAACATALWLTVLLTIVACAIAILILPWGLAKIGAEKFYSIAVIYVLVFALTTVRTEIDYILQYAGWIRQWSASNFIATGLPVVFLLVFLLSYGKLSLMFYTILIVAANVLSVLFSLGMLLRSLSGLRGLRPNLSLIKPIMGYGKGPLLSNFSNLLALYGVQLIIASHAESRELGLYGAISTLSAWITNCGLAVTIPAVSDWSKMLEEEGEQAVRADFRRRQASTAVTMGTVAVAAIIFAPWILEAVFGAGFKQNAMLLRVLALSWILSGLGGWYWHFLYAFGRPWAIAIPNLVAGLPTFVLSYLTFKFTNLGILGAAIAAFVGNIPWLITYQMEYRKPPFDRVDKVKLLSEETSATR